MPTRSISSAPARNDISFATHNSGVGPYPADPQAYIVSAANSLTGAVANLQASGARYIVVPNLPYSFPMGGGAGNATTRADRLLYSQTLWSGLAASGVNFVPADYHAMRLAIASNAASFGSEFIDTAHPSCTQPGGITSAWALLCSSNPAAPSHFVTPNADQTRLFADEQHLSTAGQKILADYEYSLIVAPSQISFLAEIPVKTRAAVVDAIFNQIAISQRQRAAGTFNVWVSGGVAYLKADSGSNGFPNDPGVPAAITGGIDYSFGNNLLVGAAFSGGRTQQSLRSRRQLQAERIRGEPLRRRCRGPVCGKIVGSYGDLRYDVNRIVPIGITLQSNTGRTSRRNASFAAEFGYDFTIAFAHRRLPLICP